MYDNNADWQLATYSSTVVMNKQVSEMWTGLRSDLQADAAILWCDITQLHTRFTGK